MFIEYMLDNYVFRHKKQMMILVMLTKFGYEGIIKMDCGISLKYIFLGLKIMTRKRFFI